LHACCQQGQVQTAALNKEFVVAGLSVNSTAAEVEAYYRVFDIGFLLAVTGLCVVCSVFDLHRSFHSAKGVLP